MSIHCDTWLQSMSSTELWQPYPYGRPGWNKTEIILVWLDSLTRDCLANSSTSLLFFMMLQIHSLLCAMHVSTSQGFKKHFITSQDILWIQAKIFCHPHNFYILQAFKRRNTYNTRPRNKSSGNEQLEPGFSRLPMLENWSTVERILEKQYSLILYVCACMYAFVGSHRCV